MKKLISFFLCALLMCSSAVAFAQEVDDKELGIGFTLSDEWIPLELEGTPYAYCHQFDNEEGIVVNAITGDAYDIAFVAEADLKSICEKLYSNDTLSANLSIGNAAIVTVRTDSVVTGYETHNGTLYYRYEKAYTASAPGFHDASFYNCMFLTVKNGFLYAVEYQRTDDDNHFQDVSAMLATVSYENRDIQIRINGNRIYPDSAPVIANDRTLVPIRAVAEALDYAVSWDPAKKAVTLTKGNRSVKYVIGSELCVYNDSTRSTLDVAPMILYDRTYLPLRAAAEAMNAEVEWNADTRTVEIYEIS